MATQIRKGDTVLVIAGKDKGKSGKVLAVDPAKNGVVVSGVNIISKHKKPRSAEDKGGILKRENKIDASNAQIICPECGKATRIAHKMDGDKKVRCCKKCGASLDKAISKKSKTASKSATKETEKVATKTASKAKTAAKATKKAAPKSEVAPKASAAKATKKPSAVRKSSGK